VGISAHEAELIAQHIKNHDGTRFWLQMVSADYAILARRRAHFLAAGTDVERVALGSGSSKRFGIRQPWNVLQGTADEAFVVDAETPAGTPPVLSPAPAAWQGVTERLFLRLAARGRWRPSGEEVGAQLPRHPRARSGARCAGAYTAASAPAASPAFSRL
jgi:hypothetical protein